MGRGVAWSFEEKHTPMGLISHSSVLYNAIQMTGKTTAREKSQLHIPLGIFVILVSKFNQTTAVRFLLGIQGIYRMRAYLIVVVLQATTDLGVIHVDPVCIYGTVSSICERKSFLLMVVCALMKAPPRVTK